MNPNVKAVPSIMGFPLFFVGRCPDCGWTSTIKGREDDAARALVLHRREYCRGDR